MPVVIARVHPKPGHLQEVLEIYAEAVPLVHQEPGCELFALHTDQTSIFVVERWTTDEDLKVHSATENFARTRARVQGLLGAPADVWVLDAVPAGDPLKGVLP
ncbi:putative quinol monooxygenase [Streptomyces sp. NPDC059070]|uniref:putative quinol monooxygenase n=1 Tax=unclassified Streptomyces TaxID=2593676 RepID=UPI0034E1F32E